jgi:hypothetical protein
LNFIQIVNHVILVRDVPRNVDELGEHIGHPHLRQLLEQFIYEQQNQNVVIGENIPPVEPLTGKVYLYPSAVATYYAPSDLSGIGGMHREIIRASSSWHGGHPRYDCVVVEHDAAQEGFKGLYVARIFCFLSVKHHETVLPCALVQWFSQVDTKPCQDTGMWIVKPDSNHPTSVIHLDCILRGVHLIGVVGNDFLPTWFTCHDSLEAFQSFFVNKFSDNHAHEILF